MKAIRLEIPEVILLKPNIFSDHRGFLFESFNQKTFETILGKKQIFVQDNHSYSQKNTLRGLHFQMPPYQQGKLIRVIRGKIFDVAVDIRRNSPNFGKSVSVILSSENKYQLWIPPGFAHGFLALANTELLYKTTNFYNPESEKSILWNDPEIAIKWPNMQNSDSWIFSQKDKETSMKFKELENLANLHLSPKRSWDEVL
ncbi:MAG TPA: dTDP-4-dehydrorhamnose 3,5-epimerase [Candidatus Megaira endosymbiont of Nemacystus decipiens]|nr:dTDP-4-dehydrorhamnose 3,5-epimerase [Candidatus Megaera endosymbiont of Nemacystus decipiens]